MSPSRPCLWPGSRCPLFAVAGRSFCLEHQRLSWKEQNLRRPRWLREFYDSREWRLLRAAHLELHPECEDCLAAGRREAASQVDHIQALRIRPDLALEPSNLRSLCRSCHSSRRLTERHHRGVGR
jgi:5-methylcytosine-specific restriction endonuclease McrA